MVKNSKIVKKPKQVTFLQKKIVSEKEKNAQKNAILLVFF